MIGKKLMAATAIAAAVVASTAGLAHGAATVTPNTGLTNNQFVTINYSGFNPNEVIFFQQCWVNSEQPGFDPNTQCSPVNGINPNANASGGGTVQYQIWSGLDPNIGEVACAAAPVAGAVENYSTCFVRLAPGGTGLTSRDESYPITFAGTQPPVPEAPYGVLLPVGAIALLGGAYFVKRNRRPTGAAV